MGCEFDVEAIVRTRIQPVLKFFQTQDVRALFVLGVRSAHIHNSVLLLTYDGIDSVHVIEEILDHPIVFFHPVAVAKGLEQDTSSASRRPQPTSMIKKRFVTDRGPPPTS